MERITHKFSLDLHKNGVQRTLQGFETGDARSHRVKISLREGDTPFVLPQNGVGASLYVTLPNGTQNIEACTRIGDEFICDLTSEDYAAEGIVSCQLKVYSTINEGQVIVAPKFQLEVWESDVSDSEAIESPVYSALQEAIMKADYIYNNGKIVSLYFDDGLILYVEYGYDENEGERITYETDAFKNYMESIRAGSRGATFTPSVSSEGIISWTNDDGLPNPEPQNIKGPQGPTGDVGTYVGDEEPTDPSVTVWIDTSAKGDTVSHAVDEYLEQGNIEGFFYPSNLVLFEEGTTEEEDAATAYALLQDNLTLQRTDTTVALMFGTHKLSEVDIDIDTPSVVYCSGIAIDSNDLTIFFETFTQIQMGAIVSPSDCTQRVKWSTSNPNVITISSTGLITRVGQGEATITAMCGAYTDTINVTVKSQYFQPAIVRGCTVFQMYDQIYWNTLGTSRAMTNPFICPIENKSYTILSNLDSETYAWNITPILTKTQNYPDGWEEAGLEMYTWDGIAGGTYSNGAPCSTYFNDDSRVYGTDSSINFDNTSGTYDAIIITIKRIDGADMTETELYNLRNTITIRENA